MVKRDGPPRDSAGAIAGWAGAAGPAAGVLAAGGAALCCGGAIRAGIAAGGAAEAGDASASDGRIPRDSATILTARAMLALMTMTEIVAPEMASTAA